MAEVFISYSQKDRALVAPCALMPPFNRIHTDDLSKWTGESNDPTWIKLVDRIAKVIGKRGRRG